MHRLLMLLGLGFAPSVLASDLEAAVASCRDCHRPDFPRGTLPLLEGQHAAYLEAQLARFAELHREGFPMESIAAGLDKDMAHALAAHFSAQAPLPHGQEARPALVDIGRARAEELACATCHGGGFEGGDAIPHLANQAPAYLEAQLDAIRGGRRYHPPTATGARIADLDDGDLRALAHFIASMR